MALTIQCGSERVLINGLELLPVRSELHPSWVYPNGCTDSNKLLSQAGSVWMFFPRPKSAGRHLLFQLPRISCAGKDCSRLVIPATLEFQSEPLKNRDFTLHG